MGIGRNARSLAFAFLATIGALFVLGMAGIPSCTDSRVATPPPPVPVITASVDALIGPEGGAVTHPAGARIVIPAGALSAPTRITLAGIAPPAAQVLGGTPLGQGFAAGPEGLFFLKPIDVIVPFDPTRVPAGTNATGAQLRAAAHGSSDFTPLQSVVDLTGRTLTARTIHFTDFIPAVNPNPVFITTPPAVPDAVVGQAYAQQLAATGGSPPYTWSLSAGSGLPPGLALGGGGALSGTPSVPTSFAFFVTAADGASHSVQAAFTLTVNAPENPLPVLAQVTPSSVPQGSAATAITLDGSGFVPASRALIDGTPLATTFTSATRLGAAIPAAALVDAGTHQVAVTSPAPGGGTSASVTFTVTPVTPNPVPTITSVSPTQLPISSVDAQIAIVGTSFIPTSSAAIGAQGISTAYVSATQLNATIPASYLGAAGTLNIGVYNPPPGGGFSATTIPITVGDLNPLPSLTAISPSSTVEGSSDFTLTATGTSFVQGGVLFFGSTALATTVASATSASATVTASLVTTASTVQVTFVNPTPGGGASGQLPFTITSVDAGAPDATVDSGADAADACLPTPIYTGPCGDVGGPCCGGTTCNNSSLACLGGICAQAYGLPGSQCSATNTSCYVLGGGSLSPNLSWPGGNCYMPDSGGSGGCYGSVCEHVNTSVGLQDICIYSNAGACVPLGGSGCGGAACCLGRCERSDPTSAVYRCCQGRYESCRDSSDCCGSMVCTNGTCAHVSGINSCTGWDECGMYPGCCDGCTGRCGIISGSTCVPL